MGPDPADSGSSYGASSAPPPVPMAPEPSQSASAGVEAEQPSGPSGVPPPSGEPGAAGEAQAAEDALAQGQVAQPPDAGPAGGTEVGAGPAEVGPQEAAGSTDAASPTASPCAPGGPPAGPGLRMPESPDVVRGRAADATKKEVDKALGIARLLVVPVLVLILLAFLSATRDTPVDSALREGDWVAGHLALMFFLIAGQLVCALLIREHWRTLAEVMTGTSQPRAGWGGRWVAFVAVLIFVVLTVFAAQLPLDSWWHVAWAGVVGEAFAIAVVLGARQRFIAHTSVLENATHDSTTQEPPTPFLGAEQPTHAQSSPDDSGQEGAQLGPAGPAELVAIGASGGGIRAAAFVLGGINAVQSAPRYATQTTEPEVFAVSGGSYTAAALALRRRFRRDPAQEVASVGWREAFTVGSPELDYLRRHTRYLFEPGDRLRDGAVSLLVGAVVNLFIVAAMIRGLSWLTAQLAVTSGLVTLTSGRPELHVSTLLGWVVAVSAVVVAATSFGRWLVHRKFDRGLPTGAPDIARMGQLSTVRTAALFGAVTVVLILGVPLATTAILDAVTANRPTATVAGIVTSTGFGTQEICQEALVKRVETAALEAERRARLTPGTESSVDTGACGVSVTVGRTLSTQDDDDPANDVVAPVDAVVAEGLAGEVSAPIQIGTIVALLGTVVGLLTKGPAADAVRQGGWITRLKRWLMTWVPLIVTGAIGLYLLLLWHLHYLLGVANFGSTFWNAGFLIVASVLAFFLDANATSMHQFYRERLSSAFAVGVEPDGSVEELPPGRVYRFSDLRREGDPHLNVVTTLNTQTANEVPTLRGGMPLVFGPHEVALFQTRGVCTFAPTDTYETFAGAGRTSIMATVAMSGAAISPLMGRYADQMKPYRILLTLFNLRVGMWMLNPAHTQVIAEGGRGRPPGHDGRFAVTARPGPAQVALEAVGSSSAHERWVYVSDGGHLDNTAMVECVRHALRRSPPGAPLRGQVIVLDASNDPPGAWSAVGDALNVVRADLGIDLVRKFTRGEPPWLREFVHLTPGTQPGKEAFRVIVVKAVRVEPSADGGESDWHQRLPEPVKSTQFLRPDFPRSSTARQRFGDLEFEAYRAYGYAAVSEALAFLDRPPQPRPREPFRSLTPSARGRMGG